MDNRFRTGKILCAALLPALLLIPSLLPAQSSQPQFRPNLNINKSAGAINTGGILGDQGWANASRW
ncbi:MAG: hypothetical protein WBP29_04185 [Candidatus Zixiibacteriota bacterium]